MAEGKSYLLKAREVLIEWLISALSSGEQRGMGYLDKTQYCRYKHWNGLEEEKQKDNEPRYRTE